MIKQSFCKSENLSLNELAYIGDDTSDIEILKNVGIPFAVNGSMHEVKKRKLYCSRKGGDRAF